MISLAWSVPPLHTRKVSPHIRCTARSPISPRTSSISNRLTTWPALTYEWYPQRGKPNTPKNGVRFIIDELTKRP